MDIPRTLYGLFATLLLAIALASLAQAQAISLTVSDDPTRELHHR